MTTLEQATTWILNRRRKILRYGWIPSGVIGLLLLGFGYQFGERPFHLIVEGTRTTATIVDYEEHRRSNGTSGYTPIVEFEANRRSIRFKNWMGYGARRPNSERVTVFYDAANPSHAMIDRGFLNWIPWGPSFAIGVVLTVSALRRWLALLGA